MNEKQRRAQWTLLLGAALFALCLVACETPPIYTCPVPTLPCDFIDAGPPDAADDTDAAMAPDADAGP